MGKETKSTICKACGQVVEGKTKTCPNCGASMKKPFYKKIWFWVLVVIVLFFMLAGNSGSTTAGVSQEEYDALNTELESTKAELEAVKTEYAEYKEKMSEYEALSEEEAQARQIEAEAKIKAEEEAQAKADAEAAAAAEAESKKGYETGITYDQIARTPDDYEGKLVKFTGEVVQVIEGDDETDIRLAVAGDYDNIIYCGYDPSIVSSRVLEGDEITIYGTSINLLSYESTLGGTITIPAVYVDKIDQ